MEEIDIDRALAGASRNWTRNLPSLSSRINRVDCFYPFRECGSDGCKIAGVVRKADGYKGNEVSRAKNGLSAKMREAERKEGRERGRKGSRAQGICFWSRRRDPVLWDNGIPFSSRGSALTRVVYPSKISKIKPGSTERTLDFNQRRSCLPPAFLSSRADSLRRPRLLLLSQREAWINV